MTYSAEVLADSPLAYWRLGDASGTTMTDASGNARHGTYSGGPSLGQPGALVGDSDTAVTFDGVDDQGSVTSAAWMHTAAFAIEAWVKGTKSGSTDRTIASVWHSSSPQRWVLATSPTTGRVTLFLKIGTTFPNVQNTTDVLDGNWHHVVGMYDGTAMHVYVDGAAASTTTSGSLTATGDMTIGAKLGGVERWIGGLDEVAYYGGALSAGRILAHRNAGAGGITGTLSATLPKLTASLTGTYRVGTDTSNRAWARRRGGLGLVTSESPVAPVPPGTVLAQRVDKAVPLPTPVMVDGRPT